jgi:two-component system, chemotaxis family, protein-glutamate methylesterase/glutaminase
VQIAAASIRRASNTAPPPIRVLVIDDSVVARAALSRMIGETPEFELVAALDGAQRAIDWLQDAKVDIILLDIQMPGLDGLAALPRLIEVSDRARILMVSTLAAEGAKATVRALSLGAADTLAKPQIGGLGQTFAAQLIDKMRRLGRAERQASTPRDGEVCALRPAKIRPVACLAIGASTGGLHALASFLGALPQSFRAPILVTQHLPPAFMEFFAEQLSVLSGRPAEVAVAGTKFEPGHVYVAPGHAHLGCVRVDGDVRAALLDHDVESRCCPSVDPMFASVAEVFGGAALGVMLTGMGRDGAIGADAICNAGGTVIAQDAASSAVWGMPGTVARAGLASLVAPPAELAAYVRRCGSSQ